MTALEVSDDIINVDIFISRIQKGSSNIVFSSLSGFYLKTTDESLQEINNEQISFSNMLSGNMIVLNNKVYALPLELYSESPIKFNDLTYSGHFKLKPATDNSINIINCIDLEDYVAGVISAEIGSNAPIEALKAQAVATRTITIKKIINSKHSQDGYDLCNTVHCQVYHGLKNQSPASYRAAMETSGMILLYNNEPIEAVYSSSCGGVTECAQNLWGSRLDYLQVSIDSYCIIEENLTEWQKKHLNWQKEFTVSQLQQMFSVSNISSLKASSVGENNTSQNSDRIEKITIYSNKTVTIDGQYKIREAFNLPSTLFIIHTDNDTALDKLTRNTKIIFSGNGYGHGVGMCQTGAISRAKEGQSYTEILDFYYPNTTIDAEWLLNHSAKER